jgi:hypothetical protein
VEQVVIVTAVFANQSHHCLRSSLFVHPESICGGDLKVVAVVAVVVEEVVDMVVVVVVVMMGSEWWWW